MSLDFLRVVVVIAPPLSTFPIDMISAIFSFRVLPPASPAASPAAFPAFDRFSEMIRFGTVNELYFFFRKCFIGTLLKKWPRMKFRVETWGSHYRSSEFGRRKSPRVDRASTRLWL